MDKNSITGIILIAVLVVGYNIMFPPVFEETNTSTQDTTSTTVIVEEVIEETAEILIDENIDDSNVSEELNSKYGAFSISALGQDEEILIENDKLQFLISSKGGRISSAILKEYQTSDSFL